MLVIFLITYSLSSFLIGGLFSLTKHNEKFNGFESIVHFFLLFTLLISSIGAIVSFIRILVDLIKNKRFRLPCSYGCCSGFFRSSLQAMKELYFGLTNHKNKFSGFEMVFYMILLLFVIAFAFGWPALLYAYARRYVKNVKKKGRKKASKKVTTKIS